MSNSSRSDDSNREGTLFIREGTCPVREALGTRELDSK
jgi:hypothetical protein